MNKSISPIESYDMYLSTGDAIIAHECRLTDLTVTGAILSGSWIPGSPKARVERVRHSGSEMDIQLQAKDAGYLKCVHVVLRQQGGDVVAHADWVACAGPDHDYGYDLSDECNRLQFEGLKLATGPKDDRYDPINDTGPWAGYGVAKLFYKRSPMLALSIEPIVDPSDGSFVRVRLLLHVDVAVDEVRVGLHWVYDVDSYGGVIADKQPKHLKDGWLQVDYTLEEVVLSKGKQQGGYFPTGFFPVVFFATDGEYKNAWFKTELGYAVTEQKIVRLDDQAVETLKLAESAFEHGYAIVRRLGKGAMGEVWEVEDMSLRGPHLAMKVFNPIDQTNADGLRERFAREARVLHEISHDVMRSSVRLPRIHRLVQDPKTGNPFYVMDFIVGPQGKPCNLGEIWRDDYADMFDEEHVAEWFKDVCRALTLLHRHHCLHRDIKPENILVDADGHAVLADFGTANILSGVFSEDGRNNITMVRVLAREQVGTREYWAPELLSGKPASEASDIYALAATFWNLLFGEKFGQEDYPPEREKFSDWDGAGIKWFKTLTLMLSPKPGNRPRSVEDCLGVFNGINPDA